MFTEKTVLVLGAGASCHINYPSGNQLLERIIYTIKSGVYFYSMGQETKKFWDDQWARELARELETQQPSSIDAFLTNHVSNPELIREGKFFTAYEILKCEDLNAFAATKDWYALLRDNIREDCKNAQDLEESLSNLNIITFNYDISLEYRLSTLLPKINIFPKEQQEKERILRILSNNIIHIYGQVGWFKWQGHEHGRFDNAYGRDIPGYGRDTDWPCRLAGDVQKNIRVIGEDRTSNLPDIKKAQQWLLEAEKIFFLGFGFRKENIELLKLDETTRHARNIYCTNCDSSQRIKKIISTTFSEMYAGQSGKNPFYSDRSRETIDVAECNIYEALSDRFLL